MHHLWIIPKTKHFSGLLGLVLAALLAVGLSGQIASADETPPASGADEFDAQMQPILQSYLEIGEALAADTTKGVSTEAERIHKLAAKLDPKRVSGADAKRYEPIPANLGKAAEALGQAEDLPGAREAYKKLSAPILDWASMSKPASVNVVYCPMAKASWLQRPGAVRNPYYGSEMLRCGRVVSPSK